MCIAFFGPGCKAVDLGGQRDTESRSALVPNHEMSRVCAPAGGRAWKEW